MNILQIVPELKCGGVETGTIDVSKRLVEGGHGSFVISAGGPMVKLLESHNAVHIELPVNVKSIINVIRLIGKVAGVIENYKIDVVHARSRVPAWIGYFAARRTGRAFITTCHGYYNEGLFSKVMGWGKFVIAISSPVARHMCDDFGVPMDRIRLVPRGVDLERFKFNWQPREKRQFTIGIIGRLSPIKGHAYFLKSLPMVLRQSPGLRVLIVGGESKKDEKYKESLVVLARRLGVSKCVEFLGHQENVPSVLEKLDLLVLATVAPEAFGRVIVEAQAAGVPVIATKVGGVVDIIEDGKTGILVAPQEPLSMADAIIKIYKDPALAKALAAAARVKVDEEFGLDKMFERTIAIYDEALRRDNILITKLGAPGDVVLATPSFRAIRDKFPNAKISALVGVRSSQILLRSPYIDEVIIYDKGEKKKTFWRLFDAAGELRKRNFDITVDLQNNSKTHLLAFLSGAQRRYGYQNGKFSFLLTHKVMQPAEPISPLRHQQRVLGLLGIRALNEKLELWLVKEDIEHAEGILEEEWFGGDQLLVGINLGSSKSWLTKRWPLASFARLQDELSKRFSARVVVFGTRDDAELFNEYKKIVKTKPIDAVGKTSIMELAALIKRCDIIVSSDSAPIHVAAAVGTPFVALFGPTDPRRHLPPAENYRLLRVELDCSPCYRRECAPLNCMKKITVEEVLEAIRELLEDKTRVSTTSVVK